MIRVQQLHVTIDQVMDVRGRFAKHSWKEARVALRYHFMWLLSYFHALFIKLLHASITQQLHSAFLPFLRYTLYSQKYFKTFMWHKVFWLLHDRWFFSNFSPFLYILYNVFVTWKVKTTTNALPFNPLMPNSDLYILLCLTPDDFTHQRETPRTLKS